MNYTLQEKYKLINKSLLICEDKNPIKIIKTIMKKDFINIHGPEHHYLDGACFLVAYKNSGGIINIEEALDTLSQRTINMPGAMCGYWGVCGSVTSIGAALSIITSTTPLSNSSYYKDNMEYTSSVIKKMSEIGGPRCCKRNAFLSLLYASEFVKNKYNIKIKLEEIHCEFSVLNKQCIKERCLFYKK